MPNVTLIHATGMSMYANGNQHFNDEYAARLLAFTKNTRLRMTPNTFEEFFTQPMEKIQQEIDYMVKTIRSSWEFVDLVFLVSDVSRACAQQITRTRNASFAMQSQRVTDVSGSTYHTPDFKNEHGIVNEIAREIYLNSMQGAMDNYECCIKAGGKPEDARGILPINVHCNLVAKYNLRSFVELIQARESYRVQGEYREVAAQMKALCISNWPWAEKFFLPKEELVIELISECVNELHDGNLRMKLAKAIDLLKKG